MSASRLWWALALALVACAGPPAQEPAVEASAEWVAVDPPAAVGAFAPWLAVDDDGPLLSWLEPLAEEGHRLVVSRRSGESWSEPVEIVRGDDFFANWADVPGIGVAGDGALLAHWLVKTGEETYAYSIELARSTDGGASWAPLGTLHDDDVRTEHGFVSWVPEGEAARAVWLDGREMPGGGPMGLRTAIVDETVGPSTLLDERVCECCPTDLAVTSRGALAVYRDRSEDETRNIGRSWATDGSEAGPIHADGWRIPGCPVNGPGIDGDGDSTAVAWFTAADERPRVQVAFSTDGGTTFGPPQVVDSGRPLGRVDLRLAADGSAVVTWLESREDRAELTARRMRPDGGAGEPRILASTGAARSSGIPRLARWDGAWLIAWVDTRDGRPERLRALRLSDDAI